MWSLYLLVENTKEAHRSNRYPQKEIKLTLYDYLILCFIINQNPQAFYISKYNNLAKANPIIVTNNAYISTSVQNVLVLFTKLIPSIAASHKFNVSQRVFL